MAMKQTGCEDNEEELVMFDVFGFIAMLAAPQVASS
jgi:hypothetical protein